jgi:hypothetical protein
MNSNPDLLALHAAKVARALELVAPLRPKIVTQQLLLWLAVSGVLACLLVDIALIYHFGAAIGAGGDPAADPTWFDRIARVLAGCVVFVAISVFTILGVKAVEKTAWPMTLRALAGATAALIALGTAAIAAGLAWGAYGEVVYGISETRHVATGMGHADQQASAPLWVRLTLSTVVMASGVAGALLELSAAKAFMAMRALKERVEAESVVLVQNDDIERLATACRVGQAELDAVDTPDAALAYLKNAITQAINAYAADLPGRYTPVERPLAEQTPESLERMKVDAMRLKELQTSVRNARQSLDRLARQHQLAMRGGLQQLPPAAN